MEGFLRAQRNTSPARRTAAMLSATASTAAGLVAAKRAGEPAETFPEPIIKLVDQMERNKRLSYSMMLRALCMGEVIPMFPTSEGTDLHQQIHIIGAAGPIRLPKLDVPPNSASRWVS